MFAPLPLELRILRCRNQLTAILGTAQPIATRSSQARSKGHRTVALTAPLLSPHRCSHRTVALTAPLLSPHHCSHRTIALAAPLLSRGEQAPRSRAPETARLRPHDCEERSQRHRVPSTSSEGPARTRFRSEFAGIRAILQSLGEPVFGLDSVSGLDWYRVRRARGPSSRNAVTNSTHGVVRTLCDW